MAYKNHTKCLIESIDINFICPNTNKEVKIDKKSPWDLEFNNAMECYEYYIKICSSCKKSHTLS